MLNQSSPNLWATIVGSRGTPQSVCKLITTLSRRLWCRGFGIRSGHAKGADMAGEIRIPVGWRQIFLPGAGFGPSIPDGILMPEDSQAYAVAARIAQQIHPKWNAPGMLATYYGIPLFGQRAHTRNVFEVCGPDPLDSSAYSDLLLCWAPWQRKGVEVEGGTRTAVALALELGIPVFNLVDGQAALDALTKLVLELAPSVLCSLCGEAPDQGFHTDDGEAPAEAFSCPQATVGDALLFHKYVARE